jgi:hypothetical protein
MSTALGRRKISSRQAVKRTSSPPKESSLEDEQSVQEVFRRHFETHFQPLPAQPAARQQRDHKDSDKLPDGDGASPEEEDEDEDEWSGCSSGVDGVEMVEHTEGAIDRAARHDKREHRAFMVRPRPPLPSPQPHAQLTRHAPVN